MLRMSPFSRDSKGSAPVHPASRRTMTRAAWASLVALVALAAGCSGTTALPIPAAREIGGLSNYVGASVCQRCHSGAHALWADSRHAKALETLRATGDETNAACLKCHSTGYKEGGFVSATATPGLIGVQCEACHGAAAKHVGSRNPADIIRVPGTPICGICHSGPAQPEHDEWLESGHAKALADVRNDPNSDDACLMCHSTDYMQAARGNEIRALRGLQPVSLPSLTVGSAGGLPLDSVGCASCHAPHGSANLAQLRMPPTATCGTCHTDSQPTPGNPVHAPQLNVLNASGGRKLASNLSLPPVALTGLLASHSSLDEIGGCGKCHSSTARVSAPSAATPNQTGHRFQVSFNACMPCHSLADAERITVSRQTDTRNRLQSLRAQAAAARRPTLSQFSREALDAAILNLDLVERDGSFGVHNTAYVTALLDAAAALIVSVPAAP